jgi:septal ring factor EnvC (AmiA/AmiB activator)
MNNAHELKSLQVRADKLEKELHVLKEERERIAKQCVETSQTLNHVRQQIANFSKREPTVTEHAMLRYIERVHGINLAEVSAAILTEQNKTLIDFAGSCRIKSGGVEFVVKDRCVVSVVA